VFVVGCPRSGTTLLYHMLLSAGNFAIYRAESQVFNLLEPRFGDLSRAHNRRKLLEAWCNSSLFAKTGLDGVALQKKIMAECRNGGDFLRLVMEAMAHHQGVERWADNTPEHVLYLDRIKATIPNALVIHVIRDGRDVALSLEKQKWIHPFPWEKEKGLEVAALYWEWIVQRGRKYGEALGSDYAEIRYEDLVERTRDVLAWLSDFVGQELNYELIQKVAVGSVGRPNTSFSDQSATVESTPVGRWKTSLDTRRLSGLEELIGMTLEEMGYELRTPGAGKGRGSAARMRSVYRSYFALKLRLKKDMPMARVFASRDLSWL
jgi:hypothetical protein